jgi:hypothetical protein
MKSTNRSFQSRQRNETFLFIEGHVLVDQLNKFSGFAWRSNVKSVNRFDIESDVQFGRTDARLGRRNALRTVYQAVVALRVKDDDGDWITKEDAGTAITSNASPEAHEVAYKGAVTDALKRAARQFGNQFGNSLYDKNSEDNEAMKAGSPSAVRKPADSTLASRDGDTGQPDEVPSCQVPGCPEAVAPTTLPNRRSGIDQATRGGEQAAVRHCVLRGPLLRAPPTDVRGGVIRVSQPFTSGRFCNVPLSSAAQESRGFSRERSFWPSGHAN